MLKRLRCRYCGCEHHTDATRCWRCGGEVSIKDLITVPEPGDPEEFRPVFRPELLCNVEFTRKETPDLYADQEISQEERDRMRVVAERQYVVSTTVETRQNISPAQGLFRAGWAGLVRKLVGQKRRSFGLVVRDDGEAYYE